MKQIPNQVKEVSELLDDFDRSILNIIVCRARLAGILNRMRGGDDPVDGKK